MTGTTMMTGASHGPPVVGEPLRRGGVPETATVGDGEDVARDAVEAP